MWEDINDSRLAELLGTTTASMSRWMAGQMPSRAWIAKMAEVLPVSARYLEYGGDDLGEPPVRSVVQEPDTRTPRSHAPLKTPEEIFGATAKKRRGSR